MRCSIEFTFCFAVIIHGAVATAQLPNDDPATLSFGAAQLSAKQATRLERLIKSRPEDTGSRTKLMGYYFQLQHDHSNVKPLFRQHVIWMIRHHPAAAVMSTPFGQINAKEDRAGYTAGKAVILGNAAGYLLLDDESIAEKLLLRAGALDPKNGKWP